MNIRDWLIAVVAACALSGPAHADATAQVRRALAEHVPGFPASAHVLKTPYSGLYEVDIGDHVFYTDAQAKYLFSGDIIEAHSGTNLTQLRVQQLQRVDWNKLPLKDSFSVVYGKGARQVAVFEDPYCPYCRALDRTLARIGNLTVHVFLFPVISQDSPAKSRDIWCAPKPGQAWVEWMGSHKSPPPAPAQCDSQVLKANLKLGESLDIQSTPTMFLHDGSRITGAVDQAVLVRRLDAAK